MKENQIGNPLKEKDTVRTPTTFTPSIATSPTTTKEMYPLTTLKEPAVQPTISGQYLLDLFNITEQISRDGLVGELNKDLDVVDNFLEQATQRFSEDLIDQIGNPLKEKNTVRTPTTFTPLIAISPATNEEMYPLITLKESVVQPTISGQYMLDLFNITELISREGLVGELNKDLDLVDKFLEKATQHSSEDLIDQIGNLLKEKSTVWTPTTLTPSIATSPATNEEMYPLTTLKEPVVQSTISGQYLLWLFNRTEQISRDGLVGELNKDMDRVGNFLQKVTQSSNEDLIDQIGNPLKENSTVWTPTTFTSSIATSPAITEEMTTLKESVFQPTISGQYLLELFNRTEQISRDGLVGELNKDLVDNFLEQATQRFSEDRIDQIGNPLKENNTVRTPTTFTPSIATSPTTTKEMYPLTTLKEPAVQPTISGQYLLDLFNITEQISRDGLVGELNKDLDVVDNFLEQATQRFSEDLIDQIGNPLKEKNTVRTPTTFTPLIAISPATNEEMYPLITLKESVVQPTISGQYLLDLFNITEQINREGLVGELNKDLDLVDKVLEKATQHSNQDFIDKIGNILKENSTVWTPTTFPTEPPGAIVVTETITIQTTTETKEQHYLDLIENLGKTKLQSSEDNLKEIQALEAIFRTSEKENEDKLLDDLTRLQAVRRPEHVTTQPLTSEEFASVPSISVAAEEGVLDLIDGISKLSENENIESVQGVQPIQDVLVAVQEPDEEEVLAGEAKHLTGLVFYAGVSTSNNTVLPTVVYENSTGEIFTSSTTTYATSLMEPPLQPTIRGKNVLDFLSKVEKADWVPLKDEFNNDEDFVNQFIETGTIRFRDDLQETISHIGILLSKKTSFTATKMSEQPYVASTQEAKLLQTVPLTPHPENGQLLDLINTLGKTKVKADEKNRQELQQLEEIMAKQEIPPEEILDVELDYLNHVLNPEEYAAAEASSLVPPRQEATTPPSTPVVDEKLFDLFDEVAEVEKGERQENREGFGFISDVFKDALNDSDINFLNDGIFPLIDVLLPEEATSTAIVNIPQEVTVEGTHVGIPKVTSVTPQSKKNQDALLDLLNEDTTEIQDVAELFANLRQSDKEIRMNKIAQLGHDLYHGEETTPASSTKVSGKQTVLTTPLLTEESQVRTTHGYFPTTKIAKLLTRAMTSGPTETTKPTLPEGSSTTPITFTPIANGNKFLDTLSYLVGRVNMDLPWDDMQRVGALSKELDKDAEEKMKTVLTTPLLTKTSQVRTSHGYFPTTKTAKILTRAMTSGPTETTKPTLREASPTAPMTFTPLANGEKFLDTLSYLVGRVNMDLPRDDMQRVGALSKELDKDAEEKMKTVLTTPLLTKTSQVRMSHGYFPTTKTAKILTRAMTSRPTETTKPTLREASPTAPMTFTPLANGEKFLDTLRYLVGRVNMDLPWDDMQRVGALSKELDKDAEEKMKQEIGFVEDIMKKVGEMENRTAETTHVPPTTTMKTSTVALTTTLHFAKTTVGMRTTPGILSKYNRRNDLFPQISLFQKIVLSNVDFYFIIPVGFQKRLSHYSFYCVN